MDTEHMLARELSDDALASLYKRIVAGGCVDGDPVETLEFEIRRRWLYEQGIDLSVSNWHEEA